MKLKTLFGFTALAAILAGCDSGGVRLAPTNNVSNSNNNTSGGETGAAANPCASYARSGQTVQGNFDGTHCTCSNTFVSDNRPLTVDLTVPTLANNGLHIFEDSVLVGEDVKVNAAPAVARSGEDVY